MTPCDAIVICPPPPIFTPDGTLPRGAGVSGAPWVLCVDPLEVETDIESMLPGSELEELSRETRVLVRSLWRGESRGHRTARVS
jgi:hypothetical protein